MIRIVEGYYSDVYPIWATFLWPERHDIRDMSSMLFNGGYDMGIYAQYYPKFSLAMDGDHIIGVNSGHLTSDSHYRSRGLWVNEEYRGQGIGCKLLKHTILFGKSSGAKYIWSFPKESALGTYIRAGFQINDTPVLSANGVVNYWAIQEIPR